MPKDNIKLFLESVYLNVAFLSSPISFQILPISCFFLHFLFT